MPEVKKINGYDIKDETARNNIETINTTLTQHNNSINQINSDLTDDYHDIINSTGDGYFGYCAKTGNKVDVKGYYYFNPTELGYYDNQVVLPEGYRPSVDFYTIVFDDLTNETYLAHIGTDGRIRPYAKYNDGRKIHIVIDTCFTV